MKRLLCKLTLLSLPLLLWLAVYVAMDPFCVLRPYPDYRGQGLNPARDYLSTESLLRNYRQLGYNSFILGNSRTMGLRCADWKVWLGPEAVPFSYGSYNESLFGMARKLQLLDRLGVDLREVLLQLDYSMLWLTSDSPSPMYRCHPRLSGAHPLEYQLTLARHFCSLRCCLALWNRRGLLPQDIHYDSQTNDIIMDGPERQLRSDPEAYYRRWGQGLVAQPAVDWGPILHREDQLALLDSMRQILVRRGCRYRVVLVPGWQVIRLHPQDIDTLVRLFGRDHFLDLTAPESLPRKRDDWYDPIHFRPQVGRHILGRLYPTVQPVGGTAPGNPNARNSGNQI